MNTSFDLCGRGAAFSFSSFFGKRCPRYIASLLVFSLILGSAPFPSFHAEAQEMNTEEMIEGPATDAQQAPNESVPADVPDALSCVLAVSPPYPVAGQEFEDTQVTLTNDGNATFENVALFEETDGSPFGVSPVAIDRLAPGASVTVPLQAAFPDTAGEQTLALALRNAQGTTLPARCTLRFTVLPSANNGTCIIENLPLTVTPGSSLDLSLKLMNTGTKRWRKSTHSIISETSRINLPADVAIGSAASVRWTMKVPDTEGVFPLTLSLADGNTSFGKCIAHDGFSYNYDEKPEITAVWPYDNAICTIEDMPSSVDAGEKIQATLIVENRGESTFGDPLEALRGPVSIIAADGNAVEWMPVPLASSLRPKASVRMPVTLKAPSADGPARFAVGLARKDGVVFGSSCAVDFTVHAPVISTSSSTSSLSSSSSFASVESDTSDASTSSDHSFSLESSVESVSSSVESSEESSAAISVNSDESSVEPSTSSDAAQSSETSSFLSSYVFPATSRFVTWMSDMVASLYAVTAYAQTSEEDPIIVAARAKLADFAIEKSSIDASIATLTADRQSLDARDPVGAERDARSLLDMRLARLRTQSVTTMQNIADAETAILEKGANPWQATTDDLAGKLSNLKKQLSDTTAEIAAVNAIGFPKMENAWNMLISKKPYVVNGDFKRNLLNRGEIHLQVPTAFGGGEITVTPDGEAIHITTADVINALGDIPPAYQLDTTLLMTQKDFAAQIQDYTSLVLSKAVLARTIAAVETQLYGAARPDTSGTPKMPTYAGQYAVNPYAGISAVYPMNGNVGSVAKKQNLAPLTQSNLNEYEGVTSAPGHDGTADGAYDFGLNGKSYLRTPQEWNITGSFTVEGWIRSPTWESSPIIVANGDAGELDWYVLVSSLGNLCIGYTGKTVCDITSPIPLNTWTAFAVVHDDAKDEDRLYVNGKIATVITESTMNPSAGGGGEIVIIGRHPNLAGTINHFSGSIDTLRISPVAMTPAEITMFMQTGDVQSSSSSSLTTSFSSSMSTSSDVSSVESFYTPVDTKTVVYWKMSGPLQSSAKKTGLGVNVQNLTELESVQSGTGHDSSPNGAYFFQDDSSYLKTEQPIDFLSDFTVEAWIKGNSWSTNPFIILNGNETATPWYVYVSSRGNLCFAYTGGGDACDNTTVLQTATWYHIAAVHDDTLDQDRLYINGTLKKTFTGRTGNPSEGVGVKTVSIGRHPNTNGVYNHFTGYIDSVRLSNVARTDAEINTYFSNLSGANGQSSVSSASSSSEAPSVSLSTDPNALMLEQFASVMHAQQKVLRAKGLDPATYLRLPPKDRLAALETEEQKNNAAQAAIEAQLAVLQGSGALYGGDDIETAMQEARGSLHLMVRKQEYIDRGKALETGRMSVVQTGTSSDVTLRPDIRLVKEIMEKYRPVPKSTTYSENENFGLGEKALFSTTKNIWVYINRQGEVRESHPVTGTLVGTLDYRYYENPALMLSRPEVAPLPTDGSTSVPPLFTFSVTLTTNNRGVRTGQVSAKVENANEDFTLVVGTDPLMTDVLAAVPLPRYTAQLWNMRSLESQLTTLRSHPIFYARLADAEGRLLEPVVEVPSNASFVYTNLVPAALRTTRAEDALENPAGPIASLSAQILSFMDGIESATFTAQENDFLDAPRWKTAMAVLARLEGYQKPLPQPTTEFGKRIGQNQREVEELTGLMNDATAILGRISLPAAETIRFRMALAGMTEHVERWKKEEEILRKAWSGAIVNNGVIPSQEDLVLFHIEGIIEKSRQRTIRKALPLAGGDIAVTVHQGKMANMPSLYPARHYLREGVKSTSLLAIGAMTTVDFSTTQTTTVGATFTVSVAGGKSATVRWFQGQNELANERITGKAVLSRTDLQGISSVAIIPDAIGNTATESTYPLLTIDDLTVQTDPLWTPKNFRVIGPRENASVAQALAPIWAPDQGRNKAMTNCKVTTASSFNTSLQKNRTSSLPIDGPILVELGTDNTQYTRVIFNNNGAPITSVEQAIIVPNGTYDCYGAARGRLLPGLHYEYLSPNSIGLYPGFPSRLLMTVQRSPVYSFGVDQRSPGIAGIEFAPDMSINMNLLEMTFPKYASSTSNGFMDVPGIMQRTTKRFDANDVLHAIYSFFNNSKESGNVNLSVYYGFKGSTADPLLASYGPKALAATATSGLGLSIPKASEPVTKNRRPYLTYVWSLPRGRTQIRTDQTPYVTPKDKGSDPSVWSVRDQQALARAALRAAVAAERRGDTSLNYAALKTAAVATITATNDAQRSTLVASIATGTYEGGPRVTVADADPVSSTGTIIPVLQTLAAQDGIDLDWEQLSAQGLLNGTFEVSADGKTLIYSDLTGKKLFETTMQNADDPQIASVSIVASAGTSPSSTYNVSKILQSFKCTPMPPSYTNCKYLALLKAALDQKLGKITSATKDLGDITGIASSDLRISDGNIVNAFDAARPWLPMVNKRTITFTLNSTSNVSAIFSGATVMTTKIVPSYTADLSSTLIVSEVPANTPNYTLTLTGSDNTKLVSPTLTAGGAISRILKPGTPRTTYTLTLLKKNARMGRYDLRIFSPTIDITKVNRVEGWVGTEGGIKPTKVALFRAGFDPDGNYTVTDQATKQYLTISPALSTWVVVHGRTNSPESTDIKNLVKSFVGFASSNEQVLALDWQAGAEDIVRIPYFDWDTGDLNDALWTPETGYWLADTLKSIGISNDKTNLVGHSHGTYVAYFAAKRFTSLVGKVKSIIALDSAKNPPYLGANIPVNSLSFSNVSNHSLAIRSSFLGSIAFAHTAERSIVATSRIIDPFTEHGFAISSFTDALNDLKNNPDHPTATYLDPHRLTGAMSLLLPSFDGYDGWAVLEPAYDSTKDIWSAQIDKLCPRTNDGWGACIQSPDVLHLTQDPPRTGEGSSIPPSFQ